MLDVVDDIQTTVSIIGYLIESGNNEIQSERLLNYVKLFQTQEII